MTPQIDQLAAEGVLFRHAMSECPVCVPARRILMTGRGPYGVHMNDNRDLQPFPEGPKLAEVMTAAGYQTFASGKLHTCPQRNRIGFEDVQLNEEGRKQPGLLLDDYEAFLNDSGYGHLAYTHGLGNNEYGVRMSPIPEAYTTTHWTAQRAMEFLGRRDPTRPFFLHVSFDKPHPPITPPAEYYELYRDAEFPAPAWGDWEDTKLPRSILRKRMSHNFDPLPTNPLLVRQSQAGFAAMITHIDSMIGVLLGELREGGYLDNTLVIVTSDHGDNLFDHGDVAKQNFLAGSANVPLIVRPPRTWQPQEGLRRNALDLRTPAGLMDIMPTILDFCGLDAPSTMDGESLVPRIRDEQGDFRSTSFGNCAGAYAATDGRMKYTWHADGDVELLFDLAADRLDQRDLSGIQEFHAVRDELREALVSWMVDHDDPRAADGKLHHDENELDYTHERTRNVWNNRGRH
jgi:arylsulfatase A-like enzyme